MEERSRSLAKATRKWMKNPDRLQALLQKKL